MQILKTELYTTDFMRVINNIEFIIFQKQELLDPLP